MTKVPNRGTLNRRFLCPVSFRARQTAVRGATAFQCAAWKGKMVPVILLAVRVRIGKSPPLFFHVPGISSSAPAAV